MTFPTTPLGYMAETMTSNVDKRTVESETPVRLCNYTDVYNNRVLRQDREYMQATATAEEVSKFRLEVGDVVITKDSETADDIGIPALIEETAPDFVCGYHLAILRARREVADPRFLSWAIGSKFVAEQFEGIAPGITRVGLKMSRVPSVAIPDPGDLVAQRRIADYLDRETSQMDAMNDKIDETIAGLRLHHHSVIEQAVSNPGHPKAHLGLLARMVSGSGFPHSFQGLSEGDFPFLKVSSFSMLRDGVIHDRRNMVTAEAAEELGASIIPAGSILMAKIGAAMSLGRFVPIDRPSCIDNNMLALIPDPSSLISPFLSYVMSTQSISKFDNGGPVPSLNMSALRMLPIPLPPLREQRRIADELDRATARIDAMIGKAEELKCLIAERRSALITEVVTGRKEVP